MRSERPTPEPQGETVRRVWAEAVSAKAINRDKMKKRRSIEVKMADRDRDADVGWKMKDE